MIAKIIKLILITFIPALELRASIPVGIVKFGMHFIAVFLICVTANFVLDIIFYLALDQFVKFLCKNRSFNRFYQKWLGHSQKKIQKFVDRYGELGVAIFIGIPLPGSGVYTGALGSIAIGLKFKKFIIADLIGVTIAGILVTIASFIGSGIFKMFIKTMAFVLWPAL